MNYYSQTVELERTGGVNPAIFLFSYCGQRVDVFCHVLYSDYVVIVGCPRLLVKFSVTGTIVLAAFHAPVTVVVFGPSITK